MYGLRKCSQFIGPFAMNELPRTPLIETVTDLEMFTLNLKSLNIQNRGFGKFPLNSLLEKKKTNNARCKKFYLVLFLKENYEFVRIKRVELRYILTSKLEKILIRKKFYIKKKLN